MQATNRQTSAPLKAIVTVALAFSVVSTASLGARAQNENDAGKILKAMSDYVTSQKSVSLKFDSSIEVITPQLQKIQFNASGALLLHRPDQLRATRTGGYADVEFSYDGKTFTAFDKAHNRFAQSSTAGSLDDLVNKLRSKYFIEAPGADLLVSKPYNQLMAGVSDAKDIGPAVVDGVQCEHLAFRNHDVDWQIWIESGSRPIPRKYVITSKTVAGAPQYTLLVKDWKANVTVAPDAFTFKAPAGVKKVEFKALSNIDEIPPGVVMGGIKGDKQ
jgi:hypothetical protein